MRARVTANARVTAINCSNDGGLIHFTLSWLQIGFTRGRVYFPIRNEDRSIAGFVGYADGQLKMPPQWIGTNVVKLKRT